LDAAFCDERETLFDPTLGDDACDVVLELLRNVVRPVALWRTPLSVRRALLLSWLTREVPTRVALLLVFTDVVPRVLPLPEMRVGLWLTRLEDCPGRVAVAFWVRDEVLPCPRKLLFCRKVEAEIEG
jgi:hypothetical protein